MSPFSQIIRAYREKRNLRQSDAAKLLGYEQSYLCGLETGSKGTPNAEFVEVLIKQYKLSDEEVEVLLDSLKISTRRFTIPLKASYEEFKFVNTLKMHLGSISATEINLMQMILDMRENRTSSQQ
ncbi:MAG: helix-turn-helix transcriptional regulator [Methylotenera sp.]|nr:helix-turn-helix transcriptional regulator [Methylotenera sp.]